MFLSLQELYNKMKADGKDEKQGDNKMSEGDNKKSEGKQEEWGGQQVERECDWKDRRVGY